MLVEMPLGVYLPGQITLSVDGAPAATIAFQTCDPDGCYAGTEVAASILNALLKGQTLDLQVKNQARQPTSVPISLAGFAKAYGAIQ
jgi:invasion protein IalB